MRRKSYTPDVAKSPRGQSPASLESRLHLLRPARKPTKAFKRSRFMRPLTTLGFALGLGAGMASAATYNGKLVDESCYDAKPKAEQSREQITKDCAPTA